MKKTSCLFACLFICGSSFAGSCNELNIYLTNKTHSVCKITNVSYTGEMIRWDYSTIHINNTVQAAVVSQHPFKGADATLTISCGGDEVIRLYSRQNYCFLSEGTVTGRIDSMNDMNAAYSVKQGSYSGRQNGTITWTLTDKPKA